MSPITLTQQLADERQRIDLELLRREHRFISAILALHAHWRGERTYRDAALEGFVRCLFAAIARSSVVASFAGLGLLGTLFALQANQLLREQTVRINIQSHLIEAERRSSLIFELSQIMEDISAERATETLKPSANQQHYNEQLQRLLDLPEADDVLIERYIKSQFTPSDALVGRIAALSSSLKPYYYINYDDELAKDEDRGWTANLMNVIWPSGDNFYPKLIDRPISPERGQLLLYMLSAGVNLLPVGNAGASFSGADLQGSQIYGFHIPTIDLTRADFKGSVFSTVRFGTDNLGVNLEGADFTCSAFLNTSFGGSLLTNAVFSFVKLATLNFGPVSREGTPQLPSITREAFQSLDLTDADFTGVVTSAEFMPWLFDANAPAPKGFERSLWTTTEIESSPDGTGQFVVSPLGDLIGYNARRAEVCS